MRRVSLVVVSILCPFLLAFAQDEGASAGEADRAGRAAFERAWTAWFEAAAGPSRDVLALEVDRLAGQRYATLSRLYWHRDLDSAIAAARESGRPILALRMLGDLDQDLSCANSRFFRVVLYADAELSAYLRERFELLWTSERPVPRVTVDFGDGRVLERTVAGNSAHFVLDRRGRPVDVLPGLYGPRAFRSALESAERLARESGGLEDEAAAQAVLGFHRDRLNRLGLVADVRRQAPLAGLPATLANTQLLTLSKGPSELPIVRAAQLGPQPSIGAVLPNPFSQPVLVRSESDRLDARSRALFAALAPTDWNAPGRALTDLEPMIAAFERTLAQESELNELLFHDTISAWYVQSAGRMDLSALNSRLYTELFLTPADDPWLGMSTPGVFSALPNDGLTITDER